MLNSLSTKSEKMTNNFMKIEKIEDNIIITIPYWQSGSYTYGEGEWKVNNLIGIITKDEITISRVNYLDYKDDMQEGMPIIYYAYQPIEEDKEEFRKLCGELGIDVWEHDSCVECGKVIRGSCTMNDKGFICFECEYEKRKNSL